jgi:hypothetical protein
MSEGRLIRVSRGGAQSRMVSYIVGEVDQNRAIEVIRANVVKTGEDEIEDLGRVSEELLKALGVGPGQFISVEGLKHTSQQQQQPQPKYP